MKIKSKLKVVTVEDSTLVAKRLHLMLSEVKGVELLGNASNVAAASHLIHLKKPDIVILDIQLSDDEPNASGINLLVTLRKKYQEMVIIMLTNHAEPQYRNTCMAMGANYFFDKSIDFEKVAETLASIIQSKKGPAPVMIL